VDNTEADGGELRRTPKDDGRDRYLIANAHNDVQRLQCPTLTVLQQGLLETAKVPQICIAGESNAGKSSLINHLLHKKSLAKASSVAGKTRSVDMMLVNERVVLTDLPGLPSRDHQVAAIWERAWQPLVLQYVSRCEELRCMLYVHDIRWKVSNLVREFLADMRDEGVPVLLVLTKDDRIRGELRGDEADSGQRGEHALRQRYMRRVRRALDFDGVHVHYSTDSSNASARKARRRLLRYIESIAAAGSREECAELLDAIAADRFASM
jgi:ribosome biogenesis GTP-binding protein YsxC/EngB